MRRKSYLILALVITLAFSLRLIANHVFEGLKEGPSRKGFGADAVEFNDIAVNLVMHHEYSITTGQPTSFRAPGFPFALAIIYWIAGPNNFLAARIMFCLTGALLCLPIFLIGRTLVNERVGLLSALGVAIYPNILYYNIHFSSEPLFTLLLTCATWFWLCAWKHDSLRNYSISGLMLGLAALTRPVAFYFAPLIAVGIIWIGRRQLSRALTATAILLITVTLPIVPWAFRNYKAHDRWLLFASNGGSTFWGANNEIVLNEPQFNGQWISTERMGNQKNDVKVLSNEVDRDRLEWQHGTQFIREHLDNLPRLCWYKFVELWTPICKTPNQKFNSIIGLSYGAAIPFMLWGIWFLVRDPKLSAAEIIILLVPIVGSVLSCLLFYGSARFRSTIEPILLIFAAVALQSVSTKLFFRKVVR
jgi:4-amino-4-deoxy-L-arabinose transferase-like glycosyltransferase